MVTVHYDNPADARLLRKLLSLWGFVVNGSDATFQTAATTCDVERICSLAGLTVPMMIEGAAPCTTLSQL